MVRVAILQILNELTIEAARRHLRTMQSEEGCDANVAQSEKFLL